MKQLWQWSTWKPLETLSHIHLPLWKQKEKGSSRLLSPSTLSGASVLSKGPPAGGEGQRWCPRWPATSADTT
jgi:hypothetical protein